METQIIASATVDMPALLLVDELVDEELLLVLLSEVALAEFGVVCAGVAEKDVVSIS